MFEHDDMFFDFSVAATIVLMVAGPWGSIYLARTYGGDSWRILIFAACVGWVVAGVAIFRFFRVWTRRRKIQREMFLGRFIR
jgi:RsiW-degrading membrane proteinase PrsW (M82 family)